MIRLPSYAEADALARFLEALAEDEQATAGALATIAAADPMPCARRALKLYRAAALIDWMAGRAGRLRELETPVRWGRR
jgi:hypothetical protein